MGRTSSTPRETGDRFYPILKPEKEGIREGKPLAQGHNGEESVLGALPLTVSAGMP